MMSSAAVRKKLTKELYDIYFIQPNDLGWRWLTMLYKFGTSRLKKEPFFYLLPLAFVSVFGLYIVLGNLIVRFASLLQYGF
jgi:hypothetical protein